MFCLRGKNQPGGSVYFLFLDRDPLRFTETTVPFLLNRAFIRGSNSMAPGLPRARLPPPTAHRRSIERRRVMTGGILLCWFRDRCTLAIDTFRSLSSRVSKTDPSIFLPYFTTRCSGETFIILSLARFTSIRVAMYKSNCMLYIIDGGAGPRGRQMLSPSPTARISAGVYIRNQL